MELYETVNQSAKILAQSRSADSGTSPACMKRGTT